MMRLRLWVFTLLLIAMVMLPSTFTSSKAALSTAPAPANAPNVNLAFQKSATQSSVDSGNTADRAVDGSNGTFAQTLSEVHAWWQVDLGEIAYIDQLQIFTRSDCCNNDIRFVTVFTSEVPFVSTDLTATLAQAGVSAKPTNAMIGGGQFTTTVDLQRSARYVRIQVETASAVNLYLAEVQVMGIRIPLNTPAQTGQWTAVSPLHNSVDTAPVGHTWNSLAVVHLNVLPSKKLLFWGRDKLQTSTGSQGWYDDAQGASDAFLWDMTKQDDLSTAQDERLTLIRNTTTNLFCAGHSFLPNGNLFVAGGDSIPVDTLGAQRFDLDGHGVVQTNIFDWKQETWIAGPNMRQQRWYPSLLTLSDGQSLIMSGSFITFNQSNAAQGNQDLDTEILDRSGALQLKNPLTVDLPNYPFAHLSPDGTPFVVSGTSSQALTYNQSTGTWTAKPNLNLPQQHDQGTSVMYDRGKIIVIGGRAGNGVSRNTDLLDLNAASPQWSPGTPMHFERYYATSVLMPDGKIFIIGGSKCTGANNLETADGTCKNGAVMYPEIYDPDPASASWSLMARQQTVRMYHSVAALLPDARIVVAGGGRPGAFGEPGELKYLAHHEVEIFSPPYLFNADGSAATRPVVTSNPPDSIMYGQTFNIGVGNFSASQIQKVVLVRLPSVTHALNFDQQRVVLAQQVVDQQTLTLTAPANGTYAAPGPYMLFVIGPNGAPSTANIVILGNTPPPPLPPDPVYPTNNLLHAPSSFTLQWNDGLDAARRNPLWPVTYAIYYKGWAYGTTEPTAWSLFGSGFQCNPNANGICSMPVSGIGDGNYKFYVVANMDVSAATGVPNSILSTASSPVYFTVGYQPISTIPSPLPPSILFPNDGNVNVPSNFTVRWTDGLDASRRYPFWPVTYAMYFKSWAIGTTEPAGYGLYASGLPCNADATGVCTLATTGVASANYRFYVVANMDVTASTGVANSILSTQGSPVFFSVPLIVTLSPSTPITLFGGQSQQFSATVTGTSNTGVTWSITPAVGSISTAGLYVAPNPVTANQTITVKACSVVDATRCASDTVTLVPLTVSVTPKTVSLLAGQQVQFNASVSGATNTAVTWSLSPATAAAGSINANGLYTAPSVVSSVTSVTVTATSVANGSRSDQATVTLLGPAVTLAPSSISFGGLPLGTTSGARTVTLTNSGSTTLSISGITRSGDFAITANTCGASLAAGASCTITLTFTPTAVGLRTGALTVTDNAAGSPHTVSLSGSVVQGYHDIANCEGMAGWAWDSSQPNTPITVYLYDGTRYLGSAYAGDYRPDLAGTYGNGYHGFAWGNVLSLLDGTPHSVSVHYAQDPNSPLLNTTPRTITCSPAVSIAWIQPSASSWGPPNTLTAAGYATQGTGNVTLQWRDITLNGPWNTVAYQAPKDPNNGSWSNTIPSNDTCHVIQAIALFSGVSGSGIYNGVGQGFCSFRVIWIQPQASAGFGPPGSLVIAGSAQGGPSGATVTLWYRDDTAQSAWTQLPYQAPTDANGIWYNAIENVNYTHQYTVYITYNNVNSSGYCSYYGNNQATTCP